MALIDTLSIRGGYVSSLQSITLSIALPARSDLVAYGETYFHILERLPGIIVLQGPQGERIVATRRVRLALLRFAAPYVAAARNGYELRYPITGGLTTAARSGWLAFGWRTEADALRAWIELVSYRPRLGAGAFYHTTQLQMHRWLSRLFLHTWANQSVRA